jgi:2-polyprenyl-3-methyl-5-hydroxy-6-metoxy-1,4-benzoquinol methylase
MKDMREIVKQGYEQGDYEKHFRNSNSMNNIEKEFMSKLQEILPENSKVLDLGCGTGIPFDDYLVKNNHSVIGVDFCEKHIKKAKVNVPNAKYILGDFSKHDFNQEFDAVISLYALFHLPKEEHETMLEKIYALLKDNGKLLITLGTDEGSSIHDFCDSKMAWSFLDHKMYKDMIEKMGFKIIMDKFEGKPGDPEYHYWILAEK